jgi:transcriptional regulator with GAF, ATPase, and Fis domain
LHLGARAPRDDVSTAPSISPLEAASSISLDEPEKDLHDRLLAYLKESDGNVAEVGRRLGKKPPQIFRWLKRFGIDPDRFRSRPRRGA